MRSLTHQIYHLAFTKSSPAVSQFAFSRESRGLAIFVHRNRNLPGGSLPVCTYLRGSACDRLEPWKDVLAHDECAITATEPDRAIRTTCTCSHSTVLYYSRFHSMHRSHNRGTYPGTSPGKTPLLVVARSRMRNA